MIGESESSEYGKVIVAKDYDDDETERKGRKIKKPVDNKHVIKIDNIPDYKNEINDLKSILKNALQQQDSKLECKIKELKNEIDEQNKKIYLLSEIYKESEKFSKKIGNNLMDLKKQFNKVINTFKVLYIRKICNFILKELINRYNDRIALTKHKFKNSLGPDFSLTVVLKDIRKISKDKITALFDFLWETQQNCSKLIHFKDVKLPIFKEIFYTLINKDIKDKSKDTLYVDINEMVKLIFENMDESNMDTSTKITERIIILDKYIKEEEIKISDKDEIEIKINIRDEDDEDDEETNYAEKLQKIMSGKYKGNISVSHLLKILKDKLVSNEKETNKLLIETNNSLEPKYFYNL